MDVTDRKRAAEAVSVSDANYRTFFNSVDACLFVLSLEGYILHANDTAAIKLGYAVEELIGKSVLGLHPEDRRPEAAAIVADIVTGKVASCPLPMLAKDGRLIPVETRVVKGKWSGQDVLFGISKDLSELYASEERFSKAFQSNPSPMALTSLATHCFLDVNESFLRTLGYQRDEVIGVPTKDLRVFADPHQRSTALAAVREQGTLRNFEAIVQTKDGQFRHGLFSAEFIQLQDQRVLLTVMNDITDRIRMERQLRESEERCRLLIETIPQLAWRSSPDGLEVDCNRRWYEYTGQTPAQVPGRGWLAVVHPDDVASVTQQVVQASQKREPYEFEYRLRRALDGSYRWHLCRAIPLKDDEGQITNWFGCATDIEDLKQAQEILKRAHEEELERHRAELAHVARLSTMGEMAAGLAHELNQSLHAINNYASGGLLRILRTPQRDGELIAALQRVHEEANRAAEIVRRVRRFVQKRKPQLSEVCVNQLVEGVVALTKADVEQRQARLVLELSENLPVVVGDQVQIEQVVVNLVRNALEALDQTPEANRVLAIKTAQGDGDHVQVEVRDRGRGIDAGHRERVFEPFFTTKSEGMGMGLAISRSIIQAHGGSLWLSANEDAGSTFHFTLPIAKRR
jgi:PAS domain S-box-containing protein